MAPGIEAVRRLGKASFQFHAEEIIYRLAAVGDVVELFILSRIAVRKRIYKLAGSRKTEEILRIHRGKHAGGEIVVREELSVLQRIAVITVICAEFLVNGKITAVLSLQGRKVLGAVEFEVAGFIIGALNKQMIDFLRVVVESRKGSLCGGRIPVGSKIRREKSLAEFRGQTAVIVIEIIAHLLPAAEILHLHRDAVPCVFHRIHFIQGIIHIEILHDGEVEIHRFRFRAGDDLSVFDFQSDIGIVPVIPGQDRRKVLSVPPAVQVDSDRFIRKDLPAGNLRCDVFFGILIIELVVVVGIRGAFPVIFDKVPEKPVELAADPFDRISALIHRNQAPIRADRIVFVLLFLLIPVSGIDDDPGSVGNGRIRNADLVGGIGHEILFRKIGDFHKVQIFLSGTSPGRESVFQGAAVSQHAFFRFQGELSRMNSGARNQLYFTELIRFGNKADAFFIDSEIV